MFDLPKKKGKKFIFIMFWNKNNIIFVFFKKNVLATET